MVLCWQLCVFTEIQEREGDVAKLMSQLQRALGLVCPGHMTLPVSCEKPHPTPGLPWDPSYGLNTRGGVFTKAS